MNDQCVVRNVSTGEERFGKVDKILPDGSAEIAIFADAKRRKANNRVRIWSDGDSSMGAFMLIKHVPHAEYLATGKV